MNDKKLNTDYDVFHAFLVENADYSGGIELPCIKTSQKLPNNVITFSKAMSKACKDFDRLVIFYEHDKNFERLWNNPRVYLEKLKKFNGIISPDFSLYRSMPLVMQQWNTYRGRAIAVWLQNNGIEIIPNIRFNDERTFEFCFDGIEKNKTVAVGTHGCIRNRIDREYFKNGLDELVRRLSPQNIVVYGFAPDDIFAKHKNSGITILQFDCEHIEARKQVTA